MQQSNGVDGCEGIPNWHDGVFDAAYHLSARVLHAPLDMAMEPFNVADALLEILAQRLAKTLCE